MSGSDIKEMSFEQALRELETIINQLESGSYDLEQAVASYERGAALQKHCASLLEGARMRVDKITRSSEQGRETTVETAPFDNASSDSGPGDS